MESLFMPVQFKASVQLKPIELDESFEAHLLYKLQQEYEGKCSRHGFIKPNSLTILQRSMGRLMKPHFNGHIQFNVLVSGEVCNPVEGMVVSATVKNKNVLGVLAESLIRVQERTIPVLDIIIPKRTAGISSQISLETLNIGDVIQVEILGKRFQLHDQRISIIGRGVESAESVASRRVKVSAKEILPDDLQEGGSDDGMPEDGVGGGDEDDGEGEGEDGEYDEYKNPAELPFKGGEKEGDDEELEETELDGDDLEEEYENENSEDADEDYCE